MKRTLAAVAALIGAMALTFGLAAPAQAAKPQPPVIAFVNIGDPAPDPYNNYRITNSTGEDQTYVIEFVNDETGAVITKTIVVKASYPTTYVSNYPGVHNPGEIANVYDDGVLIGSATAVAYSALKR